MRRAMMSVSVAAALGLLLCVGARCEAQTAGQDKEIEALRAEWVQDLEEQKLEPSLALFTDDAVFLTPDGTRMAGKDAIRGLYQQVFATYSGKIVLNPKQLAVAQYMAYESGSFHETLTTVKTGAKRLSTGSYLMVYRRDPDGKWQIAQQAWTEKPSAASGDGAGHP